jgi:hypothetical protein
MSEEDLERCWMSSEVFVECVRSFLDDVSRWCTDHDLTIEGDVITIREGGIPEYEAPRLHISKGGKLLTSIVPIGRNNIGVHGRVDLEGSISSQSLYYALANYPETATQRVVGSKTGSPIRVPYRFDRDGWYWIDPVLPRLPPTLVDESLFLDLITDVSDYEFR